MLRHLIKTSALVATLALGGTAIAGNNADTSTQEQANKDSVRLMSLDHSQIKEVQTQLKDGGFYQGKVDGLLGNMTKGALVAYFQHEVTLVQQDRISDGALGGFGFSKADIDKVRGVDESKSHAPESTKGQETPSAPKK